MIKYPRLPFEDPSVSVKPPVAFALTEFHALLAYSDMMKGISSLNSELIFEDRYNESFGRLTNVVKDPIKGKLTYFQSTNVNENFFYLIRNLYIFLGHVKI